MAGEREWAAPVKAAASGAGRVQYWWAEEAGAGPAGPSIELDEEEKDGRERKNRGDDKWAHR